MTQHQHQQEDGQVTQVDRVSSFCCHLRLEHVLSVIHDAFAHEHEVFACRSGRMVILPGHLWYGWSSGECAWQHLWQVSAAPIQGW